MSIKDFVIENTEDISFIRAIIPLLFLIAFLTFNVFVFEDTLGGSNQMALILSAFIAMWIARGKGVSWEKITDKITATIGAALPSILVLLIIGALSGTWLLSGVIPAMIYYGLSLISPKIFLLTAVVVCAIVSLVTGSSWSTIATVGVALIGIGNTLGFSPAISAGAIISGAYFGDKMSPLSDTTNLAPAMVGTNLFTHIRYMMITTVPSMGLTLIIFTVIGLFYAHGSQDISVVDTQLAIKEAFHITPWFLVVPVLLGIVIVKKIPAFPALIIGTLLGAVFAVFFQADVLREVGGHLSNDAQSYIVAIVKSMSSDVTIITSDETVNRLLTSSGMQGMLNTIWLILSAMCFGGAMEAGGLLERITRPIMKRAKTDAQLVLSTVVSCIFFNTTASDQYLAIVVPGKMFNDAYDKQGLKPENLSRTLEDSGTITSVLVPWNTCGAAQSRVLSVATVEYLPYCFFNLISPLMTVFIAFLGYKIKRKNH